MQFMQTIFVYDEEQMGWGAYRAIHFVYLATNYKVATVAIGCKRAHASIT